MKTPGPTVDDATPRRHSANAAGARDARASRSPLAVKRETRAAFARWSRADLARARSTLAAEDTRHDEAATHVVQAMEEALNDWRACLAGALREGQPVQGTPDARLLRVRERTTEALAEHGLAGLLAQSKERPDVVFAETSPEANIRSTAGFARFAARLLEEDRRQRRRRMPSAAAQEAFALWSFADLRRARPEKPPPKGPSNVVGVEHELGKALLEWRNCVEEMLRRLRGGGKPPAERTAGFSIIEDGPGLDAEEQAGHLLIRLLRQAAKAPDLPFSEASKLASLRSARGFRIVADRAWLALYRQRKERGEAGMRSGVHAGAGPDTVAPRPSFRMRRTSPEWDGDIGFWTLTGPLLTTLRAVGPFWLARRGARGEVKDPVPALRTLAAGQGVSGTSPRAQSDDRWATLDGFGVPIADLDDPALERAWLAKLPPQLRDRAEEGRQRAAAALGTALAEASPSQREAWNAAVAMERTLAQSVHRSSHHAEAADNAWVHLFGDKEKRKDAGKAFEALVHSRKIDTLLAALVTEPTPKAKLSPTAPSAGAAPPTARKPAAPLWSAGELRALIAWCEVWCEGAGIFKGLRHRSTSAHLDALERTLDLLELTFAAFPEAPAGAPTRDLLALGGFTYRILLDARRARASSVVRPLVARAESLLERGARAVKAMGGADATWRRAQTHTGAAPLPAPPGDRLLAAVLDAEERLAGATWLGGGLPADHHVTQVVNSLAVEASDAGHSTRARARRALTLTRARFPPPAGDPGARAVGLLLASAVPVDLCPTLALGLPVLVELDSTAYADDHEEPLQRLGADGDAALIWLGRARIVLMGPGWVVPGRPLVASARGTPSESWSTGLVPGAWAIVRDDRLVTVLHIRSPDRE
jgi:hypothetical protein